MDQHHELLTLAGRAPDGWLAVARETLGEGGLDRLAELRGALQPVLAGTEGQPSPRFTPALHGHEQHDQAVVTAVSARPGTEACWATMRGGVDRVYLVQTAPSADRPAITLAAQNALAEFEPNPRVEVFGRDAVLPDYHESALLSASLLWSPMPAPPIRVARVFDGTSQHGRWFAEDHPLVDDPEERAVQVAALRAGEAVFATEQRLPDVVSGERDVVPATLRSDGLWIWSDATCHYLQHHRLAVEPDLAEHLRLSGTTGFGPLSPLTRHHVRAALSRRPAPQAPARDGRKDSTWRG